MKEYSFLSFLLPDPYQVAFLLFLLPLTVRGNFAESGARPGLNFDLREIGGEEKATIVHIR